jgi:nucleotide-binding universal stress UspA family protein
VAVDESKHALDAARYVGSLLRANPDAMVTLFHVLKPMPRALLEHGGSEDPDTESRLREQLRTEQRRWTMEEQEAECSVLEQARKALMETGFDPTHVRLKFGHEEDVARNILEEAMLGGHGTIALGRHGTSRMKRFLGGGVTDQVVRDAKGIAVWIVD